MLAGFKSVAAEGYAAPGVIVAYTKDPDMKSGAPWQALAMTLGIRPCDLRTGHIAWQSSNTSRIIAALCLGQICRVGHPDRCWSAPCCRSVRVARERASTSEGLSLFLLVLRPLPCIDVFDLYMCWQSRGTAQAKAVDGRRVHAVIRVSDLSSGLIWHRQVASASSKSCRPLIGNTSDTLE